MGSLNGVLSIATQALEVNEGALQTTNNNIANVNTAGYSRQIVELNEVAPTIEGSLSIGNGVTLAGFQSIRDQVLDTRIQQQTSEGGSATAQSNLLNTVQTLFPTTGASVGTALSSFFTSLSALSGAPASTATRQAAMASAQSLVNQFHSVSNGLTSMQSSLNTQVTGDVSQVNQLTQQIAAINTQLAAQSGQGASTGTLQDQQNQLVVKLSALTSVVVTRDGGQSGGSITVTTDNGTPLVVGGEAQALTTSVNSSGLQQVFANGSDITSSLSGGDLGGTLTVRDTTVPGILSQLDTLASQFATAFNAAQAQGFDQNGNAGSGLFTVPATVSGAAANISLATTDPSAIAASSDGSAGSNGNLVNLTALQNSALPSGVSSTNAYANLVLSVGNSAESASANASAIQTSLTQLADQQSAVSGVSIDEESANLIRYQQAYEAAAQVVSTIRSLYTVTMQMMS